MEWALVATSTKETWGKETEVGGVQSTQTADVEPSPALPR